MKYYKKRWKMDISIVLGVILIVVKFDFMNLKGAAAGEAGMEVSDDDDF